MKKMKEDPCRLARQVNQIARLELQNLVHLPSRPAGVNGVLSEHDV